MRQLRYAFFLFSLLFCALAGIHSSYGWNSEDALGGGPAPDLTRFEKCPAYPTSKEIFLGNMDLRLRELSVQTEAYAAKMSGPSNALALGSSNFIDDRIFSKIAADNIPASGLSSDAEFVRRVYLDTTGRIPSSRDVRLFLQSQDPDKRATLIDQLLNSDEFKDRMTLWLGDLVRNTAAILFPTARMTYYQYLKGAVAQNIPYNQLAHDLITGKGDNYTVGAANYVAREFAGGPIQDTYDNLTVAVSKQFLGVPLECITCHNGAYHLEQINLYLSNKTRRQLWGMSAFFSGAKFERTPITQNEYKWNISDVRSNGYDTRARGGLRPPRVVENNEPPVVPPAYLFTRQTPASSDYREQLARLIVADPQFARATVNRLWREFMGVGIVDPVDAFDLARQDPANPPAAPWTVQPSHPELLNDLAREFQSSGYDLKHMISLILKSNTYQLSARFDGVWDDRYARYFARHMARRLSAEQMHDSIGMATQLPGNYTVEGMSAPVPWAVQLPDPTEPRSNGAVVGLLNIFQRGDRNISERPALATGSIFQSLTLMNNGFVTQRVKTSTPNSLVQRLRGMGYSSDQVIDELFLSTLSRYPTAQERSLASNTLGSSMTNGLEDLHWTLINKLDFIFY